MSAAGPRAALALKTQSALMSGDMGIAPTVAGGQAQRAAAAAQATATGSAGDAYDLRALANASDSLDNGHKALCPLSRPRNPGIMLDDGAGMHAWYSYMQ